MTRRAFPGGIDCDRGSLCDDRGKAAEIGKDFVDKYLYDIEKAGIHSYRYRTKAQGTADEKIIRKKKEQPEKAQLGVDKYGKYDLTLSVSVYSS